MTAINTLISTLSLLLIAAILGLGLACLILLEHRPKAAYKKVRF
jgi:uncharacterized membrane protein